jgi:hypothetical protein
LPFLYDVKPNIVFGVGRKDYFYGITLPDEYHSSTVFTFGKLREGRQPGDINTMGGWYDERSGGAS